VHEELHAPDSSSRGVGSWFDVPWRELFWESADVGPLSGAGEAYGLRGGVAESRELFWGEDVGD